MVINSLQGPFQDQISRYKDFGNHFNNADALKMYHIYEITWFLTSVLYSLFCILDENLVSMNFDISYLLNR